MSCPQQCPHSSSMVYSQRTKAFQCHPLLNKCWHCDNGQRWHRENLCPKDDLLQLQPTMRLHMGLVGPGLSGGVRKYVEGMDVRTGALHGELTQSFCQKTKFSLIISKFNPQVSLHLYFCLKQQRHCEVLATVYSNVHFDLFCFKQGPAFPW